MDRWTDRQTDRQTETETETETETGALNFLQYDRMLKNDNLEPVN